MPAGLAYPPNRNELVDRLTLAAPNDDAEYDEGKNPRHDPNQPCSFHVSLLFANNRQPRNAGDRKNRIYFNMFNWCINVIIAGPKITTIKAGKMKNTSGGTIFTLVLALISSARCRRFNRMSSE